MLKLGCCFPQS